MTFVSIGELFRGVYEQNVSMFQSPLHIFCPTMSSEPGPAAAHTSVEAITSMFIVQCKFLQYNPFACTSLLIVEINPVEK